MSRDRGVKSLHQNIAHLIPQGWRLCGENCYAEHSIQYDALPSYFLLFSIWNEDNVCLSWDETMEWAELLELVLPPVLYAGPWDEARVRGLDASLDLNTQEGYVVRTRDEYAYEAFSTSVAKWVRANHVTSDTHWMHQQVIPNRLIDQSGE